MPSVADIRMQRPYVLDVSRLVWRLWSGRLPTGIDRVCLAYVKAFARRSRALLQWREKRVVLRPGDSDALFALLLRGTGGLNRKALVLLLSSAVPRALMAPADLRGRVYLNVGHTGLDVASLPGWLKRKGLHPVYLVHDLIPITHPAFCRPREFERHVMRMRNALRSAQGIIVNSQDTGEELTRFARSEGLPPPPVLVAHLGVKPLGVPRSAAPHDRPYFLCIGTIEARKNHMVLLRAWDLLRADAGPAAPDLVLVGQRGWEADDVFARLDETEHGFGRVMELARCNDVELAAWIDHARALLMPSHVEGYGLPVFEAMARGTPVIATDLPVYREIAESIPRLLPPDDPAAWAAAAREYCVDGNPDRARQLAALTRFDRPHWSMHMLQVEQWLQALFGHGFAPRTGDLESECAGCPSAHSVP